MKRFLVAGAAIILAGGLQLGTAQTITAEKLVASARHKASIDGDLKAAIELYKQAVGVAGSNRALAADALIAMAECYQKLGDAEARKILEEVIRNYPDQKGAAAVARERLGTTSATASVRGDRVVWSGRDVDLFGNISPDGRYLTYVDWVKNATLMLRDLVANTSRPLTANTNDQLAQFSIFSRDGKQIAFEWQPAASAPVELRVAPLTSSGLLKARTIWSPGPDRPEATPLDWSPDGTLIAVLLRRSDTTALGVMTLDGSVRTLRSAGWRGLDRAVFSPDGKYLAYAVSADDERTRRHEVRIIAVDASHDVQVSGPAATNRVVGWSADGHVLFASDRSGSLALWAAPVAQGRPSGPLVVTRSDLSSARSLGLTPNGTLYVWKYSGAMHVSVAPFDLVRGEIVGAPTLQRFIDSRGRPRWSRDGKRLAYISCGPSGGGPCDISVWSAETNATVPVPHGLGYLNLPLLSPSGRQILTVGRDPKGQRGIHLIDVDSGATTMIMPEAQPRPVLLDWTATGDGFYYAVTRDGVRTLVERSIQSGAERVVQSSLPACLVRGQLSPDQRQFGCVVGESAQAALIVVPLSGGAPKTLIQAAEGELLNRWTWLPDSSGVIVDRSADFLSPVLWMATLSGGAPRKLNIDTSKWVEGGHFQVHPDGKHLSFVADVADPGSEVWALENILPRKSGK